MITDFPAMKRALIFAQEALEADEVPVGAVIVDSQTGTIIAEARNSMNRLAMLLRMRS